VGLLIGLGAGALSLAALLYWALGLSEGVYLGPRVVAWLYDRTAARYDGIKKTEPEDDRRYLARPLLTALDSVPAPLVLDVATGTGRLPLALLCEDDFAGRVIGLDSSRRMLAGAQAHLAAYGGRSELLYGDAGRLPFADGTFDAVTCMEALEFTRRPRATLAEFQRVLKPGGVLLVSNRVGWDCLWYPGRDCGRGRVEALLRAAGMEDVQREAWQVYYDLVWACKAEDGA
jgi:SAM-dependent methyltransferase